MPLLRWHLRALVVVAGVTTMSTEMCASRLLAPYFGSSQLVWANIIGLILVYLSVGYWLGGRVADRHPTLRGLCTLTLAAAVTIAVVPFLAHPVLELSAGAIDARAAGTLVGSFAGTIALFAVPVTLLGMVPPYAVRLAMDSVDHAGSVSGSLYSLSTIGSIIGTFGSTLVLVPAIGTRRTMLVTALALALASVPGLRTAGVRIAGAGAGACLVLVLALVLPPGQVKAGGLDGRLVAEAESRYQYVQVVEQPSGRRVLQLNEGWALHSVYTPGQYVTGLYFDYYGAAPALLDGGAYGGLRGDTGRALRVLVIGNAGGTIARQYRHFRPEAHVDGVELDPEVTRVGYRWFDMGGPNLTVHEADGRPFLERSHETWDVVIVDAFRQPYIPFYLTTREFFTLVRDHLAPDGVVMVNVGKVPGDDRVADAIGATMRDRLPTVLRADIEDYNAVIMASRRRLVTSEAASMVRADALARNREYCCVFGRLAGLLREVTPDPGTVLTDDHAPVEQMTDHMIIREATG